jgi:hypothetical protein
MDYDLDLQDASKIAMAVSMIRANDEDFKKKICSNIFRNLEKQTTPEDLANLARASKYLDNFYCCDGIYEKIHNKAVRMYEDKALPFDVILTLSAIYSEHDVLKDSPFNLTKEELVKLTTDVLIQYMVRK